MPQKQRPPPIEDPAIASSSESEEDDEEAPPSQPHATPAAVLVSSSGEEEDSSQEEEPAIKAKASEEAGNLDGGDMLYRKMSHEISRFQQLDEVDMKRRLALIEESKRKEWLKNWKILEDAEMEVHAKRVVMIGELIKLASESRQSSND